MVATVENYLSDIEVARGEPHLGVDEVEPPYATEGPVHEVQGVGVRGVGGEAAATTIEGCVRSAGPNEWYPATHRWVCSAVTCSSNSTDGRNPPGKTYLCTHM